MVWRGLVARAFLACPAWVTNPRHLSPLTQAKPIQAIYFTYRLIAKASNLQPLNNAPRMAVLWSSIMGR
jgi:hypothetical protein